MRLKFSYFHYINPPLPFFTLAHSPWHRKKHRRNSSRVFWQMFEPSAPVMKLLKYPRPRTRRFWPLYAREKRIHFWDIDRSFQGKKLKYLTRKVRYSKLMGKSRHRTRAVYNPYLGYNSPRELTLTIRKRPRFTVWNIFWNNIFNFLQYRRSKIKTIFSPTVTPNRLQIYMKKIIRKKKYNTFSFAGYRRSSRTWIGKISVRNRRHYIPRFRTVRSSMFSTISRTHYWQYAKNLHLNTLSQSYFRGFSARTFQSSHNALSLIPHMLTIFLEFFFQIILPFVLIIFLIYLLYLIGYIIWFIFSFLSQQYHNLFVSALWKIPHSSLSSGLFPRNLQSQHFTRKSQFLWVKQNHFFQPFLVSHKFTIGSFIDNNYFPIPHWFLFSFPVEQLSYNFLIDVSTLLYDIGQLYQWESLGSLKMGDIGYHSKSLLDQFCYTPPEWRYFFSFSGGGEYPTHILHNLDLYTCWLRKYLWYDFSALSLYLQDSTFRILTPHLGFLKIHTKKMLYEYLLLSMKRRWFFRHKKLALNLDKVSKVFSMSSLPSDHEGYYTPQLYFSLNSRLHTFVKHLHFLNFYKRKQAASVLPLFYEFKWLDSIFSYHQQAFYLAPLHSSKSYMFSLCYLYYLKQQFKLQYHQNYYLNPFTILLNQYDLLVQLSYEDEFSRTFLNSFMLLQQNSYIMEEMVELWLDENSNSTEEYDIYFSTMHYMIQLYTDNNS